MSSSRLPVGSSARSRPGDLHDGAGQRGPLRLALGELVRDRPGRARRGRPPCRAAKARGVISRRGVPSTRSTKATFSKTVRPARSLESWKTMPMERRRRGISRAAQRGDVEAGHLDLALGGHVGAVEQAEQGGLAGPAGAGQDDELTLGDAEGDIVEGGHPHGPAPKTFDTC